MLAVPLSSPRRKQGKPVESVALKITFRADRKTSKTIKGLVPSAVVRGGVCEVEIEGEQPAEVAEKAKAILEKIRPVV